MRAPSLLTETLAAMNNDPKRQRIRSQPVAYLCPICQRHQGIGKAERHSHDCPKATMEDVRRECKRALIHEKWAREKAESYLLELRRMHASLAAAKHELRKLKSRK